ncbi:PREDICTED: uncharacterized protein LOC105950469 [Erythranthe guttata]|uniref:uncharacterized protein LOC105950469 n=1 Tax=Erythranthe guttata TaxID=4155 RepID=UPI00064DB8C9|nr:PREDICTED: uncharacterized protein LOC105950469 [Erythranthe guttata]|eukprot:XP_012829286.1 PREDICTED: uncharacterized protein LOC105950469 [Erythranthe guttata]
MGVKKLIKTSVCFCRSYVDIFKSRMNTIGGMTRLNDTGYFSSGFYGGECLTSAARNLNYIKYPSNSMLYVSLAYRTRSIKLHRRADNYYYSRRSYVVKSNQSSGTNETTDARENHVPESCDIAAQDGLTGKQDRIVENAETKKQPSSKGVDKTYYPAVSTRGKIFRDEYLTKFVRWEDITDSRDDSPNYPIDERTYSLLSECMASHLRHTQLAKDHGDYLPSSSRKILLQSAPGQFFQFYLDFFSFTKFGLLFEHIVEP